MQISPRDVRRLRKRGYGPADFSTEKEGFQTLKNVNGVCYFFDAKNKACKVYEDRPEGCRYYPIVYSIDQHMPTVDRDVCRRTSTITKEEIRRTAPKLLKLAKELMQGNKIQRRNGDANSR